MPRRVALASALIGFAAAVAAFLGPADAHSTRVNWQPARDGIERPLALLASHPEHLRFAVDCGSARALDGDTVLFKTTAAGVISGGLEVTADPGKIRAQVGGTPPLVLPVPPDDPCAVVVRFDVLNDNDGELTLRVDAQSKTMPIGFVRGAQDSITTAWPRVTGLHADALVDAADARVDIETRPWGSTPTTRQIAALVVAVLSLALATYLVLFRGRFGDRERSAPGGDTRAEQTARSPRLAGSDILVLGVSVVALMVAPPVWDDGWVRATNDSYASLGVFSNFYELADFSQPVGYWWHLLVLRSWFSVGDALALSRAAPLLLTCGAWWTLRRAVLDRVVPASDLRMARAIAALVFVVGAFTYMITFRAEPLAALLLAGTIGAVVRFARVRDVKSLVAIAVLVALAVSAHQTGMVVPFAALAVIPLAWRWCRDGETARRVVTLVTVGTVGVALSVVLIGFDTDIGLTRTAVNGFRGHPAYRIGVLENAIRRIDILRYGGALHRFWPLLALFALAAFLVIGRGVRSTLARVAGYSAALAFAGLLTAGSFWPSHFGALVPAAALLAVVTLTHVLATPRGRTVCLVGFGVVLAVIVAWSMRSTRTLGVPGDLSSLSWADLPHLDTWQWVALAAVAAGVGALWFIRRDNSVRLRGAVVGATAFLLVAPMLMVVGLLIADTANHPRWSYGLENFKTLAGRDSCGAADVLDVVTSTTSLAETAIDGWPRELATLGGYPSWSRPASVPPVPQVWGTYDPTGAPDASPLATVASPLATVATPWFDVRGQPEVVYWSAGNASPPNRLRAEVVVERAGKERRVRLPAERPLETPWWAFRRIELPEDARAARLLLTDRRPGEWLAVTAPVVPTYESFTDVTEGHEVWRDAYLWYTMPCRSLPAATGGIVEPFRWSLGPPGENGAAIVEEYPTIERGCLFPGRRGSPDLHQSLRFCAFEYVLPDQ